MIYIFGINDLLNHLLFLIDYFVSEKLTRHVQYMYYLQGIFKLNQLDQ